MFYVYEHWRLDKDECFYVGKGTGHRAYSKKRNQHWKNIVSKLEREGFAWEVRIVASGLSEEESFKIEIERIEFWSSKVDLANKTIGGEGVSGFIHSDVSKKKMSESKKKMSQETKEKIKNAIIGKKHSYKTKEKLSLINKGNTFASGNKGKSKSDDHKEKIRLANIGKHDSPITADKIRQAHLGKKRSENHKKSISLAIKNHWAKRKALSK